MPTTSTSTHFRPLNIVVAPGSRAEKLLAAVPALPASGEEPGEALAAAFLATPKHNLRYHGGKTIAHLAFTNFYVGGSAAWQASDIHNIDTALAAAMADAHLNNVMMQYFRNQPITSVFTPSQVLAGARPASFSQGDVEKLVTELHAQGKLGGYKLDSTVFNFLLPSGTVLTTDPKSAGAPAERAGLLLRNPVHKEQEADSLQGLGGYHGSVHPASGVTVYYAVGVYSERLPDGTDNGIVAFEQPWKNVVATFYHELNEARTDPDVQDAIAAGNDPSASKFLGWMSGQGEECGDYPVSESGADISQVMREVPLADGSGTVPIQLQYSNAVKGPEGPIPAPHPLPSPSPATPHAAGAGAMSPAASPRDVVPE